ncbi:hypothetical protein B1207_09645 [Legionella quinlivanii]|uniref:Coiled-coil-containing protein n=1 Tax=Legionella quinlivanii TaxID=45073 RepID=A0A364LJ19_9GAMM|nr:hypothetical protein [Legionella quinlivanii]RAP36390.1 hypothetical protein B1207_09645 [Legionella quinlivanii]
MPHKNTLYNFIAHYIDGQKKLVNVRKLKPLTTLDKKDYYLIDLEMPRPMTFDLDDKKLELIEHHISVYATESNGIPSLSQYHYTVKLKAVKPEEAKREPDPLSDHYILHIYFNEKDELTKLPSLNFVSKGRQKTVSLDHDLIGKFLALSEEMIRPTLMQLRALKKECIEQLQQQYQIEEARASELSTDLKKNAAEHKQVIQRMIAIRLQLDPLFKHDTNAAVAEMLGAIRFKSPIAQEKPPLPPTKTVEEKKSVPVSHSRHKNKQPKKSSKKEKIRPSEKEFESGLQRLAREFAKLQSENSSKLAIDLCNMFAKTSELSIVAIDARPSQTGLSELNLLRLQIQTTGEKLLKQLVKDKNFALASTLYPFHSSLEQRLINEALSCGDDLFLDFLIQCSEHDLNYQPLRIREQFYHSPIHYCLQTCRGSIDMSGCFSTLLKHNASLLVPDEQGIPLACIILSDPNHPFQKPLTASRKLTKDFYFKLVSHLESYLSNHDLDEANAERLAIEIDVYRNRAQSAVLAQELNDMSELSNVSNMVELAVHIGNEQVHKLERAPEIIEAIDNFNRVALEFKRRQVRSSCLRTRSIKEMISDLFSHTPENIKTMSYEEILKWRLTLFESAQGLFQEMGEYVSILPAGSRRKVVKAHRGIMDKCDEVIRVAQCTPAESSAANIFSFFASGLCSALEAQKEKEDQVEKGAISQNLYAFHSNSLSSSDGEDSPSPSGREIVKR